MRSPLLSPRFHSLNVSAGGCRRDEAVERLLLPLDQQPRSSPLDGCNKKTKNLVHKIQDALIKGNASTSSMTEQSARPAPSNNTNSLFRMLGSDGMLRHQQQRQGEQEAGSNKLIMLPFQTALLRRRHGQNVSLVDLKAIMSSAVQHGDWAEDAEEQEQVQPATKEGRELRHGRDADGFASRFVVSKASSSTSSPETTTTHPCSTISGADDGSECSDTTPQDRVLEASSCARTNGKGGGEVKIVPRFPQNKPRADSIAPPFPRRVQRRRSSSLTVTSTRRIRRSSTDDQKNASTTDGPTPPPSMKRSLSCSSRLGRRRRSSKSEKSIGSTTKTLSAKGHTTETDLLSTASSSHCSRGDRRARRNSVKSMATSKSVSSLASASSSKKATATGRRRRPSGTKSSSKMKDQVSTHRQQAARARSTTSTSLMEGGAVLERDKHHKHKPSNMPEVDEALPSSIDDMLIKRTHDKMNVPEEHRRTVAPAARRSRNHSKTMDGLHLRQQVARRKSMGNKSASSLHHHRRRPEEANSCDNTTAKPRRTVACDGQDARSLSRNIVAQDNLEVSLSTSSSSAFGDANGPHLRSSNDCPSITWAETLQWWRHEEMVRQSSPSQASETHVASTMPDRWASDI